MFWCLEYLNTWNNILLYDITKFMNVMANIEMEVKLNVEKYCNIAKHLLQNLHEK